jgi:hypothetical protein
VLEAAGPRAPTAPGARALKVVRPANHPRGARARRPPRLEADSTNSLTTSITGPTDRPRVVRSGTRRSRFAASTLEIAAADMEPAVAWCRRRATDDSGRGGRGGCSLRGDTNHLSHRNRCIRCLRQRPGFENREPAPALPKLRTRRAPLARAESRKCARSD